MELKTILLQLVWCWASKMPSLTGLYVENTCISSSLDCFSITKKLRQVFFSMLNFAWQFSYQWNWRCAFLPQTQICKFGRTKFDTNTVLLPDKVLISLIILLQVLLSSWRSAKKVQLCFVRDLAFHLLVAKNFFNDFFMTWVQKEFASVVEFNRKYMKLTTFVCDLSS